MPQGGNIGQRTRNSQIVHTCWLNRTAKYQLTDNANLKNQVANTRANKSQEYRHIYGKYIRPIIHSQSKATRMLFLAFVVG